MKRVVLSGVLTSLLVLGACGASEDEEAKESISKHLMKQDDGEEIFKLDKDEADCISEEMVDGIGVDQLKEYGFLTEDGSVNQDMTTTEMKKGDADTMADAMFDCADVMAAMKKELAASMEGQDPKVKECFDEALTEKAVRGMLVSSFAGEEEKAGEELSGAVMKCALGGTDLSQD